MLRSIWPTFRVPRSLEDVTRVAHEAEVQPLDAGIAPAAVGRVWEAVQRLYRTGLHPAIQLCVRRRGAVLLDGSIGHASGNGPDDPPDLEKTVATPDTLFNIYSAPRR